MAPVAEPARLRRLTTDALSAGEVATIRLMMQVAFGGDHGTFSDDDWDHALGGTHYLLDVDGEIASHAAVVTRELHIGRRPIRTAYVEAVATAPHRQGRGHGSTVMAAVDADIRATFALGALGTGRHGFYRRLGWEIWRGPTFVRTAAGLLRTAEEDGDILVLRTPTSPPFDLTEDISCDWRPGDVW